jgi:hypothetical protein
MMLLKQASWSHWYTIKETMDAQLKMLEDALTVSVTSHTANGLV